jgi:hypothetical protein
MEFKKAAEIYCKYSTKIVEPKEDIEYRLRFLGEGIKNTAIGVYHVAGKHFANICGDLKGIVYHKFYGDQALEKAKGWFIAINNPIEGLEIVYEIELENLKAEATKVGEKLKIGLKNAGEKIGTFARKIFG